MSSESSSAPVIAWNWIIHSLANFKQVDPSTLVGLVKKAPAISDDLGKDAREMVSLRILESLFDYGNEATVDIDSAQHARICFDPSEHCQDVLKKILDEVLRLFTEKTSEPMAESERQKWDVRPFIMHKRSSLPKSPLQKLKEALLESSHPLLASLKEKSKVGVANISENVGLNVNSDAQATVAKDHLVSPKPTNENTEFQENLSQKSDQAEDYIGTKKSEKKSIAEPPAGGIHENALNDHKNNSQRDVPMENDIKLKTGIDNEISDEEWTNISAKKEAFLSSQCTLSQDSMAITGWTEINLCMKCNEGGQLLVCSSDTCPLRIHENCLGSAATLDENGKFFCSFCAYSRAISKYLEAKKKASLARRNLQAFLSSGVKCRPKISTGAGLEKNESTKIGALGETNKDDCTISEPSRLCVDNEVNSEDKGVPDEHRPSSPKSLSPEGNGVLHSNNGCLNQPNSNLPQKPIRQTRTPKRKRKGKESPRSVVCSHSRRPHKRKPQYTSPAVPSVRRKKLPWTKAEEEILKEGVRRFPSVDRKGIPWKEILDFGRDVFDKGRTTIDLKDKWRNICKGSPAPKKPKL